MPSVTILSRHPDETQKWGARVAKHFSGGEIVCLWGDLGTGKTTLVKGIAQGLKIDPVKVNSPTFVLMNAYQGRLPLFHFDLYRLDEPGEILRLDYEEYFYDGGVTLVEWAPKLGSLCPPEYLRVELVHKGEHKRLLKISAVGERYEGVVKKW